LQIDDADMPSANRYKYLMVIADQLSQWVEAFPTRMADTGGVVKASVKEIVPRYRVPESTDSDWGGPSHSKHNQPAIQIIRNNYKTTHPLTPTVFRTGRKNEQNFQRKK